VTSASATARPAVHLRADREHYIDRPYHGGESHRQAVGRVAGLLADLPSRWDQHRVMVTGHLATQRALEHVINGVPLERLTAVDFTWRAEGWEYRLGQPQPSEPATKPGPAAKQQQGRGKHGP